MRLVKRCIIKDIVLKKMITYEDFRDKRREYAFTKSVSNNPKDQDAARKIRTQMDYDDLKKQIGSKKKPQLPANAVVEGEELKEYSPNVTYQAKGGKKSGKLGKSSVYSLKDKGESKKEFRKSQVKDIKGGYLKTEEVVKEGDVHSGQGEKIQKRTLEWMRKKGQKGAPGLDAMKARTAEHKAKRGVKEEVVDEAKVDKGRSDYGKASIRNYRRKGPGHGEPAMFDPENKRGKLIDKRREEHKARRGVKKAKVPAYKVDEGLGTTMAVTAGLNAVGNIAKAYGASQAAKGAIVGGALSGAGALAGGALNYAASRNKNKKSDSKKKKVKEDKAFDYVVAKLKKQHGDGVLTKGDKMPEPSAAQKKKNAEIRAKRAKEDHRDPTEKASSGRYSDRYSNRGSD